VSARGDSVNTDAALYPGCDSEFINVKGHQQMERGLLFTTSTFRELRPNAKKENTFILKVYPSTLVKITNLKDQSHGI